MSIEIRGQLDECRVFGDEFQSALFGRWLAAEDVAYFGHGEEERVAFGDEREVFGGDVDADHGVGEMRFLDGEQRAKVRSCRAG